MLNLASMMLPYGLLGVITLETLTELVQSKPMVLVSKKQGWAMHLASLHLSTCTATPPGT